MVIYYLEEGSRKIDRNYWYSIEEAIRKGMEVAKYMDRPIRIFSFDRSVVQLPVSFEVDGIKGYEAKVFPDGTVLKYPECIYDMLNKEEEKLKTIMTQKANDSIDEVMKILEEIQNHIF